MAARRDLLVLRSRYVVHPDGPQPRRGPFVGRLALPDGSHLWAYKGLGTDAGAYLYPREIEADSGLTK
jgi:hypothetical protein